MKWFYYVVQVKVNYHEAEVTSCPVRAFADAFEKLPRSDADRYKARILHTSPVAVSISQDDTFVTPRLFGGA